MIAPVTNLPTFGERARTRLEEVYNGSKTGWSLTRLSWSWSWTEARGRTLDHWDHDRRIDKSRMLKLAEGILQDRTTP